MNVAPALIVFKVWLAMRVDAEVEHYNVKGRYEYIADRNGSPVARAKMKEASHLCFDAFIALRDKPVELPAALVDSDLAVQELVRFIVEERNCDSYWAKKCSDALEKMGYKKLTAAVRDLGFEIRACDGETGKELLRQIDEGEFIK